MRGANCKLPQPAISQAGLDKHVNDKMLPLHYSMCACEELQGYPQRWAGNNTDGRKARRRRRAAPMPSEHSLF